MPIDLKPDAESGGVDSKSRHSEVLFVLSTTPKLMPVITLKEKEVQGILITPEDNNIDLFNAYL